MKERKVKSSDCFQEKREKEKRKGGRRKGDTWRRKKERRYLEKEERKEIRGEGRKKRNTWSQKKEKEGEYTVVGEHLFYFASRHKGRNKEKSREGREKGERGVALVFKRKER